MVQNTLKQQARSFMEKHDVPYATALRAVDEPLHELRRLFRGPVAGSYSFAQGFRLVSEESIYEAAYPTDDALSAGGTGGANRFNYRAGMRYMEESVSRDKLLKEHRAVDIWHYRELYRAGLTAAGAIQLEPVFHHYLGELGVSFSQVMLYGRRQGIFGVNMDPFIFIREHYPLIPVTDRQLKALTEGSPAGRIEGFRRSLAERPEDAELWTDSYRSMAISTRKDSYNRPSLTVFSKKSAEDLVQELENRGIRSWRCTVSELADDERELEFSLWATVLQVSRNGKRIISGGSDKILLWD